MGWWIFGNKNEEKEDRGKPVPLVASTATLPAFSVQVAFMSLRPGLQATALDHEYFIPTKESVLGDHCRNWIRKEWARLEIDRFYPSSNDCDDFALNYIVLLRAYFGIAHKHPKLALPIGRIRFQPDLRGSPRHGIVGLMTGLTRVTFIEPQTIRERPLSPSERESILGPEIRI